MKKHFLLFILFVLPIIVLAYGQRLEIPKGKTKTMVVKNAFFGPNPKIFRPNAALLITDKQEIEENENLFSNNSTFGHACGYHYDIEFWDENGDLIQSVSFNQECEEFYKNNDKIQEKIHGYIRILETKPTHYTYLLKIPIEHQPDSVLKVFKDEGLATFMEDKTSICTTLKLNYLQTSPIGNNKEKWEAEETENLKKAEKKLKNVSDSIERALPTLKKSPVREIYSGFGTEIEHECTMTLYFANGTDLTKAIEIADRNGVKTLQNTPVFYYIQLIDPSDNTEEIEQKTNKYSFVEVLKKE